MRIDMHIHYMPPSWAEDRELLRREPYWEFLARPVTREIFERYHIPWQDTTVPFWEPIVQSACARGLGPDERRRLLDELNQVTR